MKELCYRELLFLLLAAAVVVSGCGGTVAAALEEAESTTVLALAGDEDEVWGFLPKPTAPPPPGKPKRDVPRKTRLERRARHARKPGPRRRWRRPREPNELARGIVLRGGVLMTVSAEEGHWPAALAAGFGYRWAEGAASRRIFDLGLDFASVERHDERVSSNLCSLRGEVLFGDWNARSRKTIIYVLGGAHVLFANSEWESGKESSSAATGLEVGVGIGSATGRWDVRAVYSFLAGSGNVRGNILVAAGFSL